MVKVRPISVEEAKWFLRAKRDADVPSLIEALRHPELRPSAVRRLGELRAHAAIPNIIPLLNASSDVLRRTAARALGRLQAKEAFEKLISIAASDPDNAARAWALYAVGCIGVDDLDSRMLQLTADPIPMVRQSAIAAVVASRLPEVSAKGARLRSAQPWRERRAIDRVVEKIAETPPVPRDSS